MTAALVALARARWWITPPRALLVLVTFVAALCLAALTQLSWTQGFRLADANQPLTGLAAAWGVLFASAWVVGSAGIAVFVDGLFHRIRWPWFARLPLAASIGILAAPALGLSLITPTLTTVIAAVVAVASVRALRVRSVQVPPAPSTRRRRSSDVRGAVGWLTVISAAFGVVGVAYAFTGAGWSAGALDGTIAMGQGITILLLAAIPLLAAVALSVPTRHGRAAVWGPLGLVALELTAVAIAYVYAPAGPEMAPWLGVSAVFGGAAVAWWSIPRLPGARGVRAAVGAALGIGFAVLFGTTAIPMLAFAVPVAAVIVAAAFARSRAEAARTAAAEQSATPTELRTRRG